MFGPVRRRLLATHAIHYPHGGLQLFPKHVRSQLSKQKLTKSQQRGYASQASSPASGFTNFLKGTTLVFGLGVLYFYITDTRASVHRWVVIPLLRFVRKDPEEAHEAGNKALSQLWAFGLYPRERGDPDQAGDLTVEVFGQNLRNPIGTSAGIDKHADIPDPLFAIGPAIVELGGVTPQPQPGNEKPRVFRLASQNAMINRYGLNSEGADHIAQRLRQRVRHFAEKHGFGHDIHGETLVLDGHAGVPPGSLQDGKLLAVNIAKNKTTPENDIEAVTKDYLYCAERLAPYADILVVNVSSPNTPGLRSLQNQEALTKILSSVVKAARSVQRTTKPAVMVKVSPDEDSEDQVMGICQAVWDADVDGIVVGNTTNKRPAPLPYLKSLNTVEQQHLLETGGFSGPHLYEKSLQMVKTYKKMLGVGPPPKDTPSREEGAVTKLANEVKADLAGSPSGDSVSDSIQTGSVSPPDLTESSGSDKQPLLELPKDRFYDQTKSEQDSLKSARSGHSNSSKSLSKQAPELARRELPKVIFATGGITNGKQALDILNAGADVAMVYTALVYGGVGTISRIKDEMRQELKQSKDDKEATKTS